MQTFNIKNNNFIKKILKMIISNKKNIKKLEKVIHPKVRIHMKKFTNKNKNKNFSFMKYLCSSRVN